ncbi:MAG: secretin N-terminal domain-containing protein [Candidatus Omnitrophota bacterium]
MKNKYRLLIYLILAFLFLVVREAGPYEDFGYDGEKEPLISMDFQDANLKDVLKIFSQQSGLNFIASEAIMDRKLTLYLDKVSVDEALSKILSANGLAYELDKSSHIFIVKELGRPKIETITKVYYLKYARVSTSHINSEIKDKLSSTSSSSSTSTSSTQEDSGGIKTAIEKILTDNGKIVEDARTNSLIVTDVPNNFTFIDQTISKLDIATPQVLIEVEMLDVSKNTADQLGVKWQNPLASLDMTLTQRASAFPFHTSRYANQSKNTATVTAATATPSGWSDMSWAANTFGPTILTIVGKQLSLDFLRSQTDTKYLARPRILTLSNETAEIKIATQESIGITTTTASTGGSSGSTTQEPERSETGVSLRVTPQVNAETGDITMFIEPEVAAAKTGNTLTLAGDTYSFRDPEKRGTKSTVMIKDGQTIVIGGLIRTDTSLVNTKVPFLGDIPLLGTLFRHKDKTKDEDRELIIFLTPHIIKEPTFKDTLPAISTLGLNREQMPSLRNTDIDKFLDQVEDKRL